MFLDVLDATPLVAQTLRWVVPTQALNEGAGRPRDVSWYFYSVDALEDAVVRFHGVWAGERRCSWGHKVW